MHAHGRYTARGKGQHDENTLERFREGRTHRSEAESPDYTFEKLVALIERHRDNRITKENLNKRDKEQAEARMALFKKH